MMTRLQPPILSCVVVAFSAPRGRDLPGRPPNPSINALNQHACRYKKAADWSLLAELVQDNPELPIIGNGDILTYYETADRCDIRIATGRVFERHGRHLPPLRAWRNLQLRQVWNSTCTACVTSGRHQVLHNLCKPLGFEATACCAHRLRQLCARRCLVSHRV